MHFNRHTLPAQLEKTRRHLSNLIDNDSIRKLRQAHRQSERGDRDQTVNRQIENSDWPTPNTIAKDHHTTHEGIAPLLENRPTSSSTQSSSVYTLSSRRASQSTTATSYTISSSRQDSVFESPDLVTAKDKVDRSIHPLLRHSDSSDAPIPCSTVDSWDNETSFNRRGGIDLSSDQQPFFGPALRQRRQSEACLNRDQVNTAISSWQQHCSALQEDLTNTKAQLTLSQAQLHAKTQLNQVLTSRLKKLEEKANTPLARKLALKERTLADRDQLIDRLIREKSELEREKRVAENLRKMLWQDLEKVAKSPISPRVEQQQVWWFSEDAREIGKSLLMMERMGMNGRKSDGVIKAGGYSVFLCFVAVIVV